jgi:hypothetical protein
VTQIDDQRVLSEASHDLANHIHRAYYFLELIGGAVDPQNDKLHSLLTGLKESMESVESIARSTMQYIRPVELRRLVVRMDDLVASLRQHVGLRPVKLGGDLAAGQCEVSVDPGRISEALAFLCRAASGDESTQTPIVIELIGGDPVGLRILRTSDRAAGVPDELKLALTARIAQLHGGALDIQRGDPSSWTLRLPVAGQGA